MSRFSESKRGLNKTTNYEGQGAYRMTPKFELYTLVCTSTFSDKFYTTNKSELDRLRDILSKLSPYNDQPFICKLAVYARENMHLRTIPLVLIVEAMKANFYIPWEVITRVIQRADEIYELLGYYAMANDRKGTKRLNKLANQLKKGVANAFYKFDEYQFAKYNRPVSPSLRDALFLTHPVPKAGFKRLFKKIADDSLETPYTWETQLSERGNTKEVWDELIASKKLGYMATLRNLRNMLSVDADMGPALNYISNREAVLRSKQLPFRFLSAYREVRRAQPTFQTSATLNAIEQAAKYSADNIPFLDDKILIASDCSGSMGAQISPRSSLMYADIGMLLGHMVHYKSPKSIYGLFSNDFIPCTPANTNILEAMEANREKCVMGATNGHKIFEWLIRTGNQPDRVMVFTDMQIWDSEGWWINGPHTYSMRDMWYRYKQIVPHAKMYLFDLAGYGQTPIDMSEKDVHLLAGWSDKMFPILERLDKGESALAEIEAVKL